jgi:hypothetical protein
LRLYGRIVKDTKLIREAVAHEEDENASYRDRLERCFIDLCREIDIPVPIWMKKNTKEFAVFRRTFFSKEQFIEKVDFDRFEMRIE